MFDVLRQVFIALLSFSRPLATKCVTLNNEQCITQPFLIDLNPVELKYYPFMISLHKCSESCNSVDDLSTEICVPSKTKKVNVKVFNTITNRNGDKLMVKHISFDCKCKFSRTTCYSKQKWNNEISQCECKNYHKCKNDYSWNSSMSLYFQMLIK